MLGIIQVFTNKVPLPPVNSPIPTEQVEFEYPQVDEITEAEPTEAEDILGEKIVEQHPNRISARVIGIRDGDTIEVDFGFGNKKTVRYIGIDTPESVDPRRSVECFGKEASDINRSLVENQIVQLEKDISETDKYGRLLRYVYLGDIFVNKYLVEEGFANSSAYPPDIKYQEDLDAAEDDARYNDKGLWGTCGFTTDNTRQPAAKNSPDDKDCSDFLTHMEAQEYFISKGGNENNNIDKLDGSDHDGIVCETLP